MSRFEERPTTCVLFYLLEEGESGRRDEGRPLSERQKIVCEDFLCVSLFSVERSVKRVKSDVCEVCRGSCGCVVSFGMGEIWIFGMHCLGRKTLPYLDSLRPRAFPCSYATVSAHRTRYYSFLFFSLATSSLSIFSLCRSIALLTTSFAGSTFFVGPNGLLGALILLNCVAKYVAIGVAAAANSSGHALRPASPPSTNSAIPSTAPTIGLPSSCIVGTSTGLPSTVTST